MYHNYIYKLKKVSSTNYNELSNVDLLEDLLKKLSTNKIILLDIKSEDNKYKYLVEKLLKLIEKYPMNYYLCSFNYELINYLKDKTNYPLGIFITEIINRHKSYAHLSFVAPSKNVYNYVKFNKKIVWNVDNLKKFFLYKYIITNKSFLFKK